MMYVEKIINKNQLQALVWVLLRLSHITKTDSNGDYVYTWYRSASLGNVYFVFSKAGYSDYISASQRIGDNCQDITVTTDAVMTP